MVVHRKP